MPVFALNRFNLTRNGGILSGGFACEAFSKMFNGESDLLVSSVSIRSFLTTHGMEFSIQTIDLDMPYSGSLGHCKTELAFGGERCGAKCLRNLWYLLCPLRT